MNTVFDIANRCFVPADIARLCVGKDAALSRSVVRCRDCKKPFALNTSDSAEYCADCWEIAGLENELQDGYITQEEFDSKVASIRAGQA